MECRRGSRSAAVSVVFIENGSFHSEAIGRHICATGRARPASAVEGGRDGQRLPIGPRRRGNTGLWTGIAARGAASAFGIAHMHAGRAEPSTAVAARGVRATPSSHTDPNPGQQ